jgi:hypothetical protein
MKKIFVVIIAFLALGNISRAQFTRYIVKLKNKGGTPFSLSSPSSYLTQRAIDRRTKYNIAYDSTDLPVTPACVTQIRNVPNVTVLNVSKWLNSVSIQTNDPNAVATINGFPFVQSVGGIAAREAGITGRETKNKFALEMAVDDIPFVSRMASD